MLRDLCNRLHEVYPELVNFRRDLHMYPELSFQETETPRKIAAFLRELGLEVKTNVGGRGVVGYLRGGKPGKTVALRADFDALPIQDEKDVDYKSRIPGVMHACGHDIHTASLLGVAKVISEVKEQLAGNVVFIHQFAEEKLPGGAKSMIEDGCLEGVDVIYGAHVVSTRPVGTVEVEEGYVKCTSSSFAIEIFGKGGHSMGPHLAVDPIAVGSQLVLNLQRIIGTRVDPFVPAVVTVGSFHSGESTNTIPDKAIIKGSARAFSEETIAGLEKMISQIAVGICEAEGARAHCTFERGYPTAWNHPEEVKRTKEVARALFGEEMVMSFPPLMVGEDFGYYTKAVPGAFFHVGGGKEYDHHHPKFDVEEESMLYIGKLFLSLVLDYQRT